MNQTNIYQKLQLIQSKIGKLIKSEENKFQRYKYVNEYDILVALKPLLEEQKLTLLFSDEMNYPFTKEKLDKEWLVTYLKKLEIINAGDTTEIQTYYFWAVGQNTDLAKAKGSAETYSIKYFLLKFFLILTSEELDPDSK